MRRCAVAGVVILIFLWAGCGSSGPKSITFAPASMSLIPFNGNDSGSVQQITPTVADSKGNNITSTVAVTYSSSNTSIADVSTSGLVCAGTWANPTNAAPGPCTPTDIATVCPTTPPAPCVATITGSASGKLSAPLNVVVHKPVDLVTVSPSSGVCIPVGGTATFTATAESAGTDITSTVYDTGVTLPVSPFLWVVNPSTAATLDTSGATCTVGNTCVITGATAGTTATVTATLESAPGSSSSLNVSSVPVTITTCP